jgi:L-alanine-DL-glutamate epimerase-like enolase superfamily enzyme
MKIEKVNLYRLKIPLQRPYKIATAEMKAFDCTLVALQAENREGLGEAMADVQGYFWETPEEVWQFARDKGRKILGSTIPQARQILSGFTKSQPCATTPFLTALEALTGNPALTPPSRIQFVPMAGILQATEREDIEKEVRGFLAQGFDTIKIKVGFDADNDILRVSWAQEAVRERALIRLDANQGYTLPQAQKLVQNIDPLGIEFLEQPFKENEWGAMAELAKSSPIPLGLDESIYGIEAVDKARQEQCARFIKFKVMKMGSAEALIRGIETAKRYGFEVILGNGAAGEVSCYHEALIFYRGAVTRAGEMNGFLKQTESILSEPYRTQGGKIILEPGFYPKLDPSKVDRLAVDRLILS